MKAVFGSMVALGTPVEVRPDSKLVILSLRPDYGAPDQETMAKIKADVNGWLDKAGLPDVEVIFVFGFDVRVI